MRRLKMIRTFVEKHIVAIGILTAIAIATAYAPFWDVGKPTYEAAVVWISAVVAAATLGTVAAALRTARDAAEREQKTREETRQETSRVQQETRLREDELNRQNREREEDISRKSQEREDRIRSELEEREELRRHDAVRPIASIRNWKYYPLGGSPRVRVSIEFDHESGQTGFQFCVSCTNGDTIVWLSPGSGRILRPPEEARRRTVEHAEETTRIMEKAFGIVPAQLADAFRTPSLKFHEIRTEFERGTSWKITCYYMDSLGWWWKQEGDSPLIMQLHPDLPPGLKMPEYIDTGPGAFIVPEE